MNKTSWTIFILLTVGLLGSLVVASNNSSLNIDNIDANTIQIASDKNGNIADHVYGKADSQITLIEYGDFQCPPCGSIHSDIKSVTETYKDKIRFVFRNFPIPTLHPNAKAASAAAEAAGLQNKYWEMHNKIFESQSGWSNSSGTERTDLFASYANTLGLDVVKFNSDIASQSIIDKIDYDYALGLKAGVDATPTFFLNNVKLEPAVYGDIVKLKEAIDAELIKLESVTPNN